MAQLCFELADQHDCENVQRTEVRPSRGAAALRNLQCAVPDKWADGMLWTRDTLGGLCQPQVQQNLQCRTTQCPEPNNPSEGKAYRCPLHLFKSFLSPVRCTSDLV